MQIRRIKTAMVPAVAVTALALGASQFASPDAAATSERLDELSAKRPAAASQLANEAPYGLAQAVNETAVGAVVVEAVQRANLELLAAELARQAEEQEAAASGSGSRRRGYAGGAGTSASGRGSNGGFLECTKGIESGGDYGAVSPGGAYRGAYQFLPSTWNNTAAAAGRSDLVGVDPAQAAPSDQDAMASQLYSTAGSAPWGGRCG